MTNLLHLIERDTRLKKVAGTQGGEWHGPCPFCGGKDRFIVQPNHGRGRWSCRQCSPKWEDAVTYVMRREGIGFREACQRLGRDLSDRRPAARPAPAWRRNEQPAALSNAGWRHAAGRFAERSYDALVRPEGAKALDYLLRRGIDRRALWSHAVGYNDRDRRETWGGVDVFLPRGIVLPWCIDEEIWKVNIRRPAGEPKYVQAAGGANALYGWGLPDARDVVVLVEGEFDALSFWPNQLLLQPGNRRVLPLATGSVGGARLAPYVGKLDRQWRVLLAFDADDAGDAAAAWWQERLGDHATRLRPTRHDINAMHVAGDDLYAWVAAALGTSSPGPFSKPRKACVLEKGS